MMVYTLYHISFEIPIQYLCEVILIFGFEQKRYLRLDAF